MRAWRGKRAATVPLHAESTDEGTLLGVLAAALLGLLAQLRFLARLAPRATSLHLLASIAPLVVNRSFRPSPAPRGMKMGAAVGDADRCVLVPGARR